MRGLLLYVGVTFLIFGFRTSHNNSIEAWVYSILGAIILGIYDLRINRGRA